MSDDLARQLEQERELSAWRERLLAAKESELRAIYASRTWAWASRLRALKYRWLDPLLVRLGSLRRSRPRASDAAPQKMVEFPKPQGRDILCFPIIDWDLRFQRPQQLMTQFGRAGHRVFYVAPTFRQDGPAYTLIEKAKNVFQVSLRGPRLNVYRDTLRRGDLEPALDALRRDAGIDDAALIVQFPFWAPLAQSLGLRPLIYDCMDSLGGFTSVSRKIIALETPLMEAADLVVASSPLLEREARKHARNVLLLRNACDYDAFASIRATKNPRPLVGYYGAISYWFDVDLVARLAAHRPDWDFLLIGDTWGADVAKLTKLANVTLPGEQPYASIPRWLAMFDVAIIPFRRMPLTEATNPVKAYEFLAGGKPIVSVPIPEMAALQPHARLASTAEEFEREIEAAMRENSAEHVAARRTFAREQTWEKRFEELVGALELLQE
jgi:glycosyltransferase involved in cell wall biosynthesis